MSLDKDHVAGILLAAGASVRMGKTKQLMPVGDGILITQALNAALMSDLDKIILVLGHKAEEIRAALGQIADHPKLKIVNNDQYQQGISTSIRKGLSYVRDQYNHLMILLGDMPYIHSGLINVLIKHYLESQLQIGAVTVKERRTHPVIFSRKLYPELDNLKGDVGGRPLFEKYRDRTCLVEPEGFYDDRDIDTPADYMNIKQR